MRSAGRAPLLLLALALACTTGVGHPEVPAETPRSEDPAAPPHSAGSPGTETVRGEPTQSGSAGGEAPTGEPSGEEPSGEEPSGAEPKGPGAAPPPTAPPPTARPPTGEGPPAVPEDEEAPAAGGSGAPIILRVGLASDLDAVTLPCCDGEVAAEIDGEVVPLVSPLQVEPAAGLVEEAVFRLQVAALKDEGDAAALARRLAERTGEPADSHFDAGVDLYRVRLGRYASREAAEAARRHLPFLGVLDAWVVSEGGGMDDPGLRLTHRGSHRRIPGRWLAVSAEGDGGVRIAGKRYRGRILVYLNDRGRLNLINELPLEDYLRGVVPKELGPEVYPRLAALKAQAVAARTYTLRNLGEFAGEGYDICATPRCQVYGGMEAEHPLSDRAIAETARQVLLFGDELIDALYTSTCGGHTEDVKVVFPQKDYPYLRGVPCLEAGVDRLAGALAPGTPFPHGLTRLLLPVAASGEAAAVLAARLEHLALLAGLPVPDDHLASLERKEVQRFLLSLFDLALDVRLFVADEEVEYILDSPPADWDSADLSRAAFLAKSGLLTGPLGEPVSADEVEGLLLHLAEMLQVVQREAVRYVAFEEGTLSVRRPDGEVEEVALPQSPPATFRLRGGDPVAGDLALVAGDRLQLFWHDGRLLAVVQEVDLDGVAYDRTSKMSSWTRFRSDETLARRVEGQFPGLGFAGFEILERGSSGRVGRIRIRGANGGSAEVVGLPVRWLLDVPETLFTARRLEPAGRGPGWLFRGKGWGHGVGLCQVGAYGMAGRGATYKDILTHYYTGTRLARVRARAGTR